MKSKNGKEILIKRIGGLTAMRCLGIAQQIIEHSGIGEIFAAFNGLSEEKLNDEKIAEIVLSLRHVFQKTNIELLQELLCMITDLDREALNQDGDDAITINDIANIFIEFYRINNLQKELKHLGELIGNQVKEAKAA